MNIEVINIHGENCKVIYPKSIYDIFYFFLFEIVDKDIVFKICKRCDKYFPCLYNKNIQFCDRVDIALDKTCREIKLETLPDTDEVKHKSDVMDLFKRTYERVRHRVRRTKEQQKKYKEWSKEARSLRQHRTKTALRLSTTSVAPEGSALGVLFFRHFAQNSLDNRQVNGARFAQSDEKIDGASAALSLCGIALRDRCISGEITLEYFEEWLSETEKEMM